MNYTVYCCTICFRLFRPINILHLLEWQSTSSYISTTTLKKQNKLDVASQPRGPLWTPVGCPGVCSQWPLVDLTTYQLWLLHTWSTSASSGNCTGHTASNRSHHFDYTPTKALNSAASENRQLYWHSIPYSPKTQPNRYHLSKCRCTTKYDDRTAKCVAYGPITCVCSVL